VTDSGGDDQTAPTVYAVRLSSHAARQLQDEHERLQEISGSPVADHWEDQLIKALAGLATLPERCAIAPESVVFAQETLRQLLYRRKRGGPVWRILFSIREATDADSPTVWIHRIRHAAQAPVTEWRVEEGDEA